MINQEKTRKDQFYWRWGTGRLFSATDLLAEFDDFDDIITDDESFRRRL